MNIISTLSNIKLSGLQIAGSIVVAVTVFPVVHALLTICIDLSH